MGLIQNIRCSTCLKVWPESAWQKIFQSDIDDLGIIQKSYGRGRIEEVRCLQTPDELKWLPMDRFDAHLEWKAFDLVKGSLLRALHRWRPWLFGQELQDGVW